MANNMLGGAAGLASGFSQGLKTGTTMFNNLAYQRRLKQQQDRLDKTAALQQKNSERDALLDVIETSTKLFNNNNIPEEMKVEQWNGPYSEAMKKATGKNVPNMARWSPDFGKVTTRVNEIAHDKKLTRVEKRQALEYISAKVRNSQKLRDSIGDSLTEMEAREDAAIEKYAQMIVKHASLRPGAAKATDEEEEEFRRYNAWAKTHPKSAEMAIARAEEIKQQRIEQLPADTKGIIYRKDDPSIAEAVKELDPTYSDILNKTAKYLKELEDKGELSPTTKYVEISKIMHEEGVPEEMREELVSEIEGLMSGKTYSDQKEEKEIQEEIEGFRKKREAQDRKIEAKERREEYLEGFYKGEISDVAKNWLDLLGQTPLIGGR